MKCALLLAPMAAAALAFPAAAQAHSPCGDSYRVERGDTLYSIAQRCRTPIEAIMQANPFIAHPAMIEVGWRLVLPGGRGGPEEPPPADPASYRVGPGDTLHSIAARLGLRAEDLIAANRGLDWRDLRIGQVIRLPAYPPPGGYPPPDQGEARGDARVIPSTAAPGDRVTVRAYGFRPHAPVMIGAGPPESEYETVGRARSDARGRIEAQVRVPRWADPGRRLEWVVRDRYGNAAHYGDFRVAGHGQGDGRGLVVTGVITREGVECPALRTDRGELYTLAGDTGRFLPGDRVTVSGQRAQMSFCMQGTTISVDDIRQAGWDR